MNQVPGKPHLYSCPHSIDFNPKEIPVNNRPDYHLLRGEQGQVINGELHITREVLFNRRLDAAVARLLIHSREQGEWVGVTEEELLRILNQETKAWLQFWRTMKYNLRHARLLQDLNNLYEENLVKKLWGGVNGSAIYFPTEWLVTQLMEKHTTHLNSR